MSPARMIIEEEGTTVLRKASNTNQLKKVVNRFRDAMKSLIVLDENIYEIEDKESKNKEKIKDQTKKQ